MSRGKVPAYLIRPGRKRTISGKIVVITMQAIMDRRKGNTPRNMSKRGTLVTPATTYTFIPMGGVINAASLSNTDMTPKHTGSNPTDIIIGKNMGIVSKIIAGTSIMQPNIRTITIIIERTR